MAEEAFVTVDGETSKVIGRSDARSSGLDVLDFVETGTARKGTVVRCDDERAVTRGSQNLFPGTYRFDAGPVMMNRATVLSTTLQDVLASTNSSSQTDGNKGGHPQEVIAWQELNELVLDHVAQLQATPAMFPAIEMPSTRGSSSEATCDSALDQSVLTPIDRLLRYRCSKESTPGAQIFQWQQQSTQTPTNSQGLAAAAAQRVVDRGVTEAALKGSEDRKPVMVFEVKRLERLERVGSSRQDVVAIWNGACHVPAAVLANVAGAIAQVNRYASLHGCRFGAFGTHRYSWFEAFQPGKVAGPYKHDCCNPTMLQVLHCLSCWAMDQPPFEPWQPLSNHPLGLGAPGSRRGSKSDAGTHMPAAEDGGSGRAGRPVKRKRGGSSSSKEGAVLSNHGCDHRHE